MGKLSRLFICASCGRPSTQWSGKCPSCGEWGTVGEKPTGERVKHPSHGARPRLAVLSYDGDERRISTGLGSVDRVLGGGFFPGSVILLAGAPGIGKSTLVLQLAARLEGSGTRCLIASGEEGRAQLASRARRLGIDGGSLSYVPGRALEEVIDAVRTQKPSVLIVDSIQTIRATDASGLPGGSAQVRACADGLVTMAKEQEATVILTGHVTKDGELAGPRTLEHAVDVVLGFEGDPHSGMRVLTGGKNRFGPEGEVAWFRMEHGGLVETQRGPTITQAPTEPGSTTGLVVAGRRGLAVEVQALVVSSEGPPRRHVSGLDPRRFDLLAAVTERATRFRLTRSEIYGSAVGGLRVDDPGADLAIAAALASASSGVAAPPGAAFVGEVSLTGSVRPVNGWEQRMTAAVGAGIRVIFCARAQASAHQAAPGLRIRPVEHVREALGWSLNGRRWADTPGDRISSA